MTAATARHGEVGSVSILVVGLATALLMVAGLLFDGGQILAGRREAFAVADNAARAGAQALDVGALRGSGTTRLDPAAASRAVHDYLARVGHTGTVTINEDRVVVVVAITVETHLLSAVGFHARTVTGTGEARAVRGITGPGG
jgi:Flp pilus assembly protein TadG